MTVFRRCVGKTRALVGREVLAATETGRDPASITRSIHLPVSSEQPSATQEAIGDAIDADFRHIVLGLPAPYPADVAQWVADALISTSASR